MGSRYAEGKLRGLIWLGRYIENPPVAGSTACCPVECLLDPWSPGIGALGEGSGLWTKGESMSDLDIGNNTTCYSPNPL